MKKMKYEMPSMKVVVLSERSQLLAGSSQGTAGFRGWESDHWEDYKLGNGGDL